MTKRTRATSLRKYVAKRRRRGTSNLTKTRYERPTASNQKKQILNNALAIRSVRKLLPTPTYCDFQYFGSLFADLQDSPSFTESLLTAELMTPNLWASVLRQDDNVSESSTTCVKRMVMNLRYTLASSNWAQFTTFVVSIRKDAVNRVINSVGLTKGQDYIKNAKDYNVRLNPAVFKVHYCRNVSLMINAWEGLPAIAGQSTFASNSAATFAKGQVSMNLNFKLRQPLGTSWRIMDQSQLGPHQRLFLLTFITQQADTTTAGAGARIDFDALYTTYNVG